MYKLSIVVPVYNAELYIDECICSIISELTEDDELILINDGSTDLSLLKCKSYERNNVCVIDQSNHGVSYTRNCGIDSAKGEYIVFVDADDYLIAGWRAILKNGLETGADVVYFSQNCDEKPCKTEIITNILCLPVEKKLDIRGSACWSKMFRRDFLKANEIAFDVELINGEDGIFNLQSLIRSSSYTIVKADPHYFYRTNAASATHSFNPKFNTSNLKYINTVNNELAESGLFELSKIKEITDYITFNSIYILACRISFVESKHIVNDLYKLFETKEYIIFYNSFENKWKNQKFKSKIFNMVKCQNYNKAIKKIKVRRKIFSIIKKFWRKRDGG